MSSNEADPEIALKYMRYHAPEWTYCDSVEDAVARAYWMYEDNTGVPTEVVSLDGVVLLDQKELDARVDEHGKARETKTRFPPHHSPPIPVDDKPAALAFARFMGSCRSQDWNNLSEPLKEVWRKKAKETPSATTRS